jgi:iron complex transport system permease protein
LEVRSQKSEVRNQKSGLHRPPYEGWPTHGRRLAFALAGALLTVAGRPVAAPAEVTVVDASGRGVGTLLLAGIAFAALASSLTGLIAYASDDRELRDLTLWMLGSLSGASWPKVLAVAPFALIVTFVLPSLTRALNGLLLGEAEAFHLGVDVERVKRLIALTTAAAVGAAVAVAGVVGFVGIVVPHLVRIIAGPDHRVVLPMSALLGAALVLGADVVARMALRPAELPLGVVMAIVGAPIFLHMVVRRGMGGS